MLTNSASTLLWLLFLLTTLLIIIVLQGFADASDADTKIHIIYMGDRTNAVSSVESLHANMLDKVTGSDSYQRLVHSYKRSFNGFAAWLSDQEVKRIASMDGVVSVFPNELHKLHTTKSWDFMGFPLRATKPSFESDVIIGMIDGGIWPESKSFGDEGFGPPPSRWKGTCQSSNFSCNNKIIGARYYRMNGTLTPGGILSPRDTDGHGSHTASTVAGRASEGVSLFGLANGTARGGVPSARIAVYKACWSDGCNSVDVLAAFEDAIADGVDIISISAGPSGTADYFRAPIAIGSFHAMKNGILTSESAGNDGPGLSTLDNNSPWSLTVAASTINRQFTSKVTLGNGTTYEGVAVNMFDLNQTMYPLVFAGDVPNVSAGYNGSVSRSCKTGSLDEKQVKGKIVLCQGLADLKGPFLAGATGMIVRTRDPVDIALEFPLPTSVLWSPNGENLFLYFNTTSNPTATIMKSQVVDDATSPFVASFSSRGPNNITRDILKPDLTAPGVNILAAWSPAAAGSLSYNIISGTSMACPHATAVAAYVKSLHPDWSPAAIKSALMTTAHPMNASKNNDTEFAYGAGHLNPIGAAHPGLVYDAGVDDYIRMLCGQGYNTTVLRALTGDNSSCSTTNNGTVWDVNYPSFALSVGVGEPFFASFKRTVTSVGLPNSTYKATIRSPSQISVGIEPSTFSFKSPGEKHSFTLKIEGIATEAVLSASLELYDGLHHVRSPIVVYTIDGKASKASNSMTSFP